ncbi:MAG TPA: addiction module protein [Thermoanaerobaculia bacterium]|nr:addiction module protein [Thermoanaerobaculia bacterium]
MTRAELKKLLELPVVEKMELAQMLWESIEPEEEADFLALHAWQRQVLDERLSDLERHPEDEQTWEEAKAELLSES